MHYVRNATLNAFTESCGAGALDRQMRNIERKNEIGDLR